MRAVCWRHTDRETNGEVRDAFTDETAFWAGSWRMSRSSTGGGEGWLGRTMLIAVKGVMTKRHRCVHVQDRVYGWNITMVWSGTVQLHFGVRSRARLTCTVWSRQPLQQGGSQQVFPSLGRQSFPVGTVAAAASSSKHWDSEVGGTCKLVSTDSLGVALDVVLPFASEKSVKQAPVKARWERTCERDWITAGVWVRWVEQGDD